jgi:hypothetical protein
MKNSSPHSCSVRLFLRQEIPSSRNRIKPPRKELLNGLGRILKRINPCGIFDMSPGYVLFGEPTRPNELVSTICHISVGQPQPLRLPGLFGGVKRNGNIKSDDWKQKQSESREFLENCLASGFHQKACRVVIYTIGLYSQISTSAQHNVICRHESS